MRVERYRGRTVTEALRRLRDDMGDDALVLRTSSGSRDVEVVATSPEEVERFQRALTRQAPARPVVRRSRIVALVGPTGSGKTTTVAKLALSAGAFAGSRVGLISLDTYKIGAFDQIQTYADLAGLPLELISDQDEVPGAVSRLARCDVILVDSPGRTPNAVPASVRYHLADAIRNQYDDLEPTHLLLTKLDEVPGEAGVAQLAARFSLPTRWIADGQNVPDDLHGAPERLLESALRGNVEEWFVEARA